MFGIKMTGSMRKTYLMHFQPPLLPHLTSKSSEVTSDLEDEPQVLVMEISHVWYQNDMLNKTNWYNAISASLMITSDLQILRGHWWPQRIWRSDVIIKEAENALYQFVWLIYIVFSLLDYHIWPLSRVRKWFEIEASWSQSFSKVVMDLSLIHIWRCRRRG